MFDFLAAIAALMLVYFAFLVYMVLRIRYVASWRAEVMIRDMQAFQELPSFDDMVWKFWVWPLEKFQR